MSKNIIKLRIILWLGLAIVVVWILWMNVVPGGKITYINDFSEEYSEFVRKLTPGERVGAVENGAQKIIGDPVYFDLRVPRRFTNAKLTVKYKNNTDLPIVEAGVLMDKKLWQYSLVPLQNKILDDLLKNWIVIEDDGLVLLQRPSLAEENIFASIDSFKNNLPNRNRIALYNTNLNNNFLLSDYEAMQNIYRLPASFRGAYKFYTYLKNEDLNFVFDFIDLNEHEGSDEININLYYQDQIIDSWSFADDGIIDDKGKQSEKQKAELRLSNLPEGVYQIEINASDDIITKNFETSQQKISFINKIQLFDFDEDVLTVFTDSSQVGAQTINPNGLQIIDVAGSDLKLENTYQQENLIVPFGVKEIKLKKGGIMLSGNGMFSFFKSAFINPRYRKIDENIDLDKEKIDYVLADYQSPQKDKEWFVATSEFDLSDSYKEFSKYKFLISVPGLQAEDEINNYLEIDEIKIELQGTSLWGKLLNVFK